jgi:hypothetical protein
MSATAKKWILNSILSITVGSWIPFFVFYAYCHDGHLPNVAQASTGHTFQSNSHGHMAYLAKSEHYTLIGLQVAAVVAFLLGYTLNRRWRVHVHPLEGLTSQQRYNVLRGRPMNKNWDD